MKRYFIPGLGIVDVITDLKVVPGPGGKGRSSSARPRCGSGGSTTTSSPR